MFDNHGKFKIIRTTLPKTVSDGSDFEVSYPVGTDKEFFTKAGLSPDNEVVIDRATYRGELAQFEIDYGSRVVKIKNTSGVAWQAGAEAIVQLGHLNQTALKPLT